MWSSLKSLCVAAALLCATACHFQPMYGDTATGMGKDSPMRGNLAVDPIPLSGHEGQIFIAALEDRFDPEGLKYAHPDYHLKVTFTKISIPAVIRSDGTIERYIVQFDSNFSLIRSSDKKVLFTGSLRRLGSYNAATNANFATYEAGLDTEQRTLEELAEDYVLRISGYFASKDFAREKAKEQAKEAALPKGNVADINARLP